MIRLTTPVTGILERATLDVHISTCFNKDTYDLFMLCIVLVCQLYSVFLLLLLDLFCCCSIIHSSLFIFWSTFVSFKYFVRFNVHCSLFIGKYSILILDCIPGISIPLYYRSTRYPSSSSKSISIIHQIAPSSS